MANFIDKKTVTIILIIVGVVVGGFLAYKLYNVMVNDATQRIRAGVSEGVSEGIGSGIGDAVNPMNLPKRFFGGNK